MYYVYIEREGISVVSPCSWSRREGSCWLPGTSAEPWLVYQWTCSQRSVPWCCVKVGKTFSHNYSCMTTQYWLSRKVHMQWIQQYELLNLRGIVHLVKVCVQSKRGTLSNLLVSVGVGGCEVDSHSSTEWSPKHNDLLVVNVSSREKEVKTSLRIHVQSWTDKIKTSILTCFNTESHNSTSLSECTQIVNMYTHCHSTQIHSLFSILHQWSLYDILLIGGRESTALFRWYTPSIMVCTILDVYTLWYYQAGSSILYLFIHSKLSSVISTMHWDFILVICQPTISMLVTERAVHLFIC